MMQKLKDLLDQLPMSHTTNLKYILAFLYEFSLYHETTKMSISNIAIVMGPNFLWCQEEMSDAAAVVSDTALQRRVAELLIEHVHWFYPDLPDTPLPSVPQKTGSYAGPHGTNPSGTYTPTAPLSSYSAAPPPTYPSSTTSTPSPSSTSSSTNEDHQHHVSPTLPTPPQVTHDNLAELRSSSPKPTGTSPPIPPKPYKGGHPPVGSRSSNPPSPATRTGSFGNFVTSRPSSGEMATSLDSSTNGLADGKCLGPPCSCA
jgi:hypothetical protein